MPPLTEEVAAQRLNSGDMILIPPATIAYVQEYEFQGANVVVYLAHGKTHTFGAGEIVTVIRPAAAGERGESVAS